MRTPISGFDRAISSDGDIFGASSELNQSIGGSVASIAQRGQAQLRAAKHLAKARVSQANTDATSSLLQGAVGGLSSFGTSALKAWRANAPTMGSGTPVAPSIDTANPTAGERALMGATYKGWL
jgi:hypothetical protein